MYVKARGLLTPLWFFLSGIQKKETIKEEAVQSVMYHKTEFKGSDGISTDLNVYMHL